MPPSGTESHRVTKDLQVKNPLGLHARPAAEFVRHVQTFRSEIFIVTNGQRYNAGRLMDVLIANLDCGSRFTLEAHGADALAAVDRLARLLDEIYAAELRGEFA